MEIQRKVHCLFEQSGVFKNEFIKLGIPAIDYDIHNNFGEVSRRLDLFVEISKAYDNLPSVFDTFLPDDLIMSFFPCIYFCDASQMMFRLSNKNNVSRPRSEVINDIIARDSERHKFYVLAIKLFAIVMDRGLRMVFENPYAPYHYLIAANNFLMPPTFIDYNRQRRGDYYVKRTAYWFVGCRPTYQETFQYPPEKKTILSAKKSKQAGICSEERSLISPVYACNFIHDFILGRPKSFTQLSLF